METQPLTADELGSEFSYLFKFRKSSSNFNDLWAMKSSARESLRDWLIAWECSPEMADSCANACSELIENCIKFSILDTVSLVSIRIVDSAIVIQTRNQTQSDHIESLEKIVEEINEAEDPRELFAARLLTLSRDRSQLGILKIRMETKGNIALVREGPDSVTVLLSIESDFPV